MADARESTVMSVTTSADTATDTVTTTESLRVKLIGETARIPWQALQPYFARGQVAHVGDDMDLVDVALELAQDNKAQFEAWLKAGQVGAVTDTQAQAWFDTDAVLWAVVVAPWVLVQQR